MTPTDFAQLYTESKNVDQTPRPSPQTVRLAATLIATVLVSLVSSAILVTASNASQPLQPDPVVNTAMIEHPVLSLEWTWSSQATSFDHMWRAQY